MVGDCGARGRTPPRSRSSGDRPQGEGTAIQGEILLPGAVPAELLGHRPPHELPPRGPVGITVHRLAYRLGQRRRRVLIEQEPTHAFDDAVLEAAHPTGDRDRAVVLRPHLRQAAWLA